MNLMKYLASLPDYKGGDLVSKPKGINNIVRNQIEREFNEIATKQAHAQEKRMRQMRDNQ